MTAAATHHTPAPVPESELSLREQLSNLRGLLALSMMMTERRKLDEILHLATTAIPALVPAQALGVHLPIGEGARWHATRDELEQPTVRADVLSQLQLLPRNGGALTIAGEPWAWAFGLPQSRRADRDADRHGTRNRPPSRTCCSCASLAQQTGIALANARLHASHQTANEQLSETVGELRHKTAIHDRFTQVALHGGGYQGVVDALLRTDRPAGEHRGSHRAGDRERRA